MLVEDNYTENGKWRDQVDGFMMGGAAFLDPKGIILLCKKS